MGLKKEKTSYEGAAKKYYWSNRTKLKEKARIFYLENKEMIKERTRKWRLKNGKDYYLKNRDKLREYSKSYIKKNNYRNEKTPKQRMLRNIKRKTRHNFPLDHQICQVCDYRLATERHHFTKPLEFNKFIFVCHDCHMATDNLLIIREDKLKWITNKN